MTPSVSFLHETKLLSLLPLDSNGYTLLIHSSEDGNVEITKLLLKYNADISSKMFSTFKPGRTALARAATKGHEGIVELLIMKNALNVSDDEGYIGK